MRKYNAKQIAEMSQEQQLETFRTLAAEYMQEHKCRWSEACLEIKKQYPESRAVFGAPPLAMEA